MGNSCQDEAFGALDEMLNKGIIEDLNEFLQEDELTYDLDKVTEALEQQGEIVFDCVFKDMNLYKIGTDIGTMMASVLQAQLDPTD